MLHYIKFYEFSEGSMADFPHVEMTRIDCESAIELLDDSLMGPRHFHSTMPKSIIPKVVTNDSYLCYKYRHAFSIEEFQKWCGIPIEKVCDRDYYIDINHENAVTLNNEGRGIFEYFQKVVRGEYSYVKMNRIKSTNFEDSFGQNYEVYSKGNYGWTEDNTIGYKIPQETSIAYNWWNKLDKFWVKKLARTSKDNYIPSEETLNSILQIEKLKILPQEINDHRRISEGPFEELDLSPLKMLKNLKELDLSNVGKVKNTDALQYLRKLETLNIEWIKINNLNFLSKMENLKYLNISYTNVSNLSPLSSLNALDTLYLEGLKNIVSLPILSKLRYINIKNSNLNSKSLRNYKIERIIS